MNYHYMKTDKIIVDDKSDSKQKKSSKNFFFINLIEDNVNTMQALKFDKN
jgi:hypothetical protein